MKDLQNQYDGGVAARLLTLYDQLKTKEKLGISGILLKGLV
jgi:hypothetical protein